METNAKPPVTDNITNPAEEFNNPTGSNENKNAGNNAAANHPDNQSGPKNQPAESSAENPSHPDSVEFKGATKEINADEIKETGQKLKLNFLKKEDDPNKFIAQPTKRYDDTTPLNTGPVNQPGANPNNVPGWKDEQFYIDMYTNIFKTLNEGMKLVGKFISGDSAAEGISDTGMKGLTQMWSNWAYKNQKQTNPFWVLVLCSLVFVLTPLITAFSKMFANKQAQKAFKQREAHDAFLRKQELDRAAAEKKMKDDEDAARKREEELKNGKTNKATTGSETGAKKDSPPPHPGFEEGDNPITTLVDDGTGNHIPLYEKLKIDLKEYTKLGFTLDEIKAGFYETAKGQKKPIKFINGLPVRKLGRQEGFSPVKK